MERRKSTRHRHGSAVVAAKKATALNFHFSVSIETDQRTGEVMAAYFQVRKGKAVETRELVAGHIFADYDRNGQLLGIELLAPCSASRLDRLRAPAAVKTFIRRCAPQTLFAA